MTSKTREKIGKSVEMLKSEWFNRHFFCFALCVHVNDRKKNEKEREREKGFEQGEANKLLNVRKEKKKLGKFEGGFYKLFLTEIR